MSYNLFKSLSYKHLTLDVWHLSFLFPEIFSTLFCHMFFSFWVAYSRYFLREVFANDFRPLTHTWFRSSCNLFSAFKLSSIILFDFCPFIFICMIISLKSFGPGLCKAQYSQHAGRCLAHNRCLIKMYYMNKYISSRLCCTYHCVLVSTQAWDGKCFSTGEIYLCTKVIGTGTLDLLAHKVDMTRLQQRIRDQVPHLRFWSLGDCNLG